MSVEDGSSGAPLCGAGTPIVTSRGESAAYVRNEFETDHLKRQAEANTENCRVDDCSVERASVGSCNQALRSCRGPFIVLAGECFQP